MVSRLRMTSASPCPLSLTENSIKTRSGSCEITSRRRRNTARSLPVPATPALKAWISAFGYCARRRRTTRSNHPVLAMVIEPPMAARVVGCPCSSRWKKGIKSRPAAGRLCPQPCSSPESPTGGSLIPVATSAKHPIISVNAHMDRTVVIVKRTISDPSQFRRRTLFRGNIYCRQ